jgi:hypothetical protein
MFSVVVVVDIHRPLDSKVSKSYCVRERADHDFKACYGFI